MSIKWGASLTRRLRLEPADFVGAGHLKLEQIKPLHLLEFYANLQEGSARKDGHAGGLEIRLKLGDMQP